MNATAKAWTREMIWIAALFTLALGANFLISKHYLLAPGTIDIQVHDTYYVIGGSDRVLTLFLLVAVPVYLVKEARHGFRAALPNVILALLLMGLLFHLLGWHLLLYALLHRRGGWVTYPPLDALPGLVEPAPGSYLEFWNVILLGLELLIAAGLFLLGYRTGKRSQPAEKD